MSSYLIVATYNHQVYSAYKDAEEAPGGDNRRVQARDTAVEIFGRAGVAPVVPLSDFFVFVDAFSYFEIPEVIQNAEEGSENVLGIPEDAASTVHDQILASKPYGWTCIVPEDEALANLKGKMGWPDSPFCNVFNIQIIALQGHQILLKPTESPDRGPKIYDDQTPKMWAF